MAIELSVEPKTAGVTWRQFRHYPEFSVALDGYVTDGPRFDPEGPRANWNHHERVDRLATRSTCAQVLMALRQGFFKRFRSDGVPTVKAYVNDCDEDVCTSWFLLKNHALCEQTVNPMVNRLVMMEDALDATAGAYPFPLDLPMLREMAWIYEPYRQFRLSAAMHNRDAKEFRSIIDDVTMRITSHVAGRGQERSLDPRYERIGGGTGWVMVKEIGAQARTGMFADGITAYVSVRERGNGRYTYVVGRLSPFIPFELDLIYESCNERENTPDDPWGGSDMVGGSPRVGGSSIDPDTLAKLIEGTLE